MTTAPCLEAGASRVALPYDPALPNWIHRRPYSGLLDSLHARCLALRCGDTAAGLVVWDLIDVDTHARDLVRQAVAGRCGLPAAAVMVAATHSHSAPRSPFTPQTSPTPWIDRCGWLLEDPAYQAFAARLPNLVAGAMAAAWRSLQPVELLLGRAWLGDWLFNRRPRQPDGRVRTVFQPADPTVLPDALRFGPVDPTLTVAALRTSSGRLVATLLHLACHAVSIYGETEEVSADWPGPLCQWIGAATGAEALLLQGCAGDIVPARRGTAARDALAQTAIERALAALGQAVVVPSLPLRVGSRQVEVPWHRAAARREATPTAGLEVQALRLGDLAICGLPGEPLTAVGAAVREHSPLPHTLVDGYTNGLGVGYYGLPGDLRRGGYESGEQTGLSADRGGRLVARTAGELLHELAADA
ncbi:MAG: hypothetical protein IT204_00560 [Fimbriimonadaceae bacterium]|nr:hypothetical protein [Fimbriimonadaceae bacterium]